MKRTKSSCDFSSKSLNCLLLQMIFPNTWNYLSLLNSFCFWSLAKLWIPSDSFWEQTFFHEKTWHLSRNKTTEVGCFPKLPVRISKFQSKHIFRKYPSSQCVCGRITFSAKVVSGMADFTEKVKYFGLLAACPEKERGSQYCNATWRRRF